MNFIDQLSIALDQLKDIVEGILRDSPQAMKHLFDLFYKPLCFHAVRYVKSMPVAEEIVSDVMYKIWQNRHQGYRTETFSEYLYAATRNTALNHLKQQQNQRNLYDKWADQLRDELIEETPLDTLIIEETQSRINNLMDTLPEQCRKIFMMSRMDEMSYDEIATQMGISTNTVKYHIKTALQKLRKGMGDVMLWFILLLSSCGVHFIAHTYTFFVFNCISNNITYIVQ